MIGSSSICRRDSDSESELACLLCAARFGDGPLSVALRLDRGTGTGSAIASVHCYGCDASRVGVRRPLSFQCDPALVLFSFCRVAFFLASYTSTSSLGVLSTRQYFLSPSLTLAAARVQIRRGSWKLITYGHTFDWFNASAFTDQLFNVDEDPFELSDVAAANPGVVSELFGQLEAELGGTGAVAAIDRFEMRENWKLFSTWFAAGRSDAEVAALLSKSFRGNTPAQVSSQYAAWKAAASAL